MARAAGIGCIFVLGGSRLIEHGTHAELLAAGGRYAVMYRQQASAYEAAAATGAPPTDTDERERPERRDRPHRRAGRGTRVDRARHPHIELACGMR